VIKRSCLRSVHRKRSEKKPLLTLKRGFGTSVELAKHGARVYIASRSGSKAEEAKNDILKEFPSADIHFLPLDLTDLESVRQAADKFTQYVACGSYRP
jgi:NAD(P)-dependent dehydrogenase (short-subunit alcohol dehydrogenase family)